ncbi:hypothetical protein AQJ46_42775 [Streptomyces canus]|uniref:Uncharacterized protein n=1 Tax=Streptomyces canus TaxID=58343 RepID=A0A117QWX3_9ACTN|nr:hypothetical protein AQJ46_42775 [Streptomyces canus]
MTRDDTADNHKGDSTAAAAQVDADTTPYGTTDSHKSAIPQQPRPRSAPSRRALERHAGQGGDGRDSAGTA